MLLAAGLALRIAAQIAYQPALIYVDTLKYLYGASPGADPLGYTLVLRAILVFGNLSLVALAQHVLGLAMAVGLYAVLLRRGPTAGWRPSPSPRCCSTPTGADRAEHHAGRLVRGADRGRPGPAALAAGRSPSGWPRWPASSSACRPRAPGRRGADRARGVLPGGRGGQHSPRGHDRGRAGHGLRTPDRPLLRRVLFSTISHFRSPAPQATVGRVVGAADCARSPCPRRCGRCAPPRPSRRRARTGSSIPSTRRFTPPPSRPGRAGPS